MAIPPKKYTPAPGDQLIQPVRQVDADGNDITPLSGDDVLRVQTVDSAEELTGTPTNPISVNVENEPVVSVSGSVDVEIQGTPTVAIDGTVPVSIADSVDVVLTGTPVVAVSGTVPVSMADPVAVTGTVDVAIQGIPDVNVKHDDSLGAGIAVADATPRALRTLQVDSDGDALGTPTNPVTVLIDNPSVPFNGVVTHQDDAAGSQAVADSVPRALRTVTVDSTGATFGTVGNPIHVTGGGGGGGGGAVSHLDSLDDGIKVADATPRALRNLLVDSAGDELGTSGNPVHVTGGGGGGGGDVQLVDSADDPIGVVGNPLVVTSDSGGDVQLVDSVGDPIGVSGNPLVVNVFDGVITHSDATDAGIKVADATPRALRNMLVDSAGDPLEVQSDLLGVLSSIRGPANAAVNPGDVGATAIRSHLVGSAGATLGNAANPIIIRSKTRVDSSQIMNLANMRNGTGAYWPASGTAAVDTIITSLSISLMSQGFPVDPIQPELGKQYAEYQFNWKLLSGDPEIIGSMTMAKCMTMVIPLNLLVAAGDRFMLGITVTPGLFSTDVSGGMDPPFYGAFITTTPAV